MNYLFAFCVLILIGCNGIGPGKSGNDNSHLRNPDSLPQGDSIQSNHGILYRLKNDLRLNGIFVCDTFILEKWNQPMDMPDSVHFGGPEIIEEFGVNDFDLFFGKSVINAGHGQILYFKIRDNRLNLFTVTVGDTRKRFERMIFFDLPNRDTINCLSPCDGVYSFQFERDTIVAIEYSAAQL